MRRDRWLTAVAFGALAGVRSAAPPALLALERERRSGPLHRRRGEKSAWIANAIEAFAVAELLADKLPWVPPRTHPVSLLVRAASGAVIGAALSPRSPRTGAALGGAAAIAGAFAAYHLRRLATQKLRVPNVVAGLVEDAFVAGAGSRLASSLP